MNTITEFVSENGVEELLDLIEAGTYTSDTPFHEVIENTSISEEDWFEFAWALNDVAGSRRQDIFHITNFNYQEVNRLAETYVEENSPVTFGDLCEYVSDTVGHNQEEIARYLELFEMDTLDERTEDGEELIVSISS
jgi:hypothetical protein